MKDAICRVEYNEELSPGYFKIGLKTGWKDFTAGQFGMLEVPPVEGVLLRRPFSFARQTGPVTEILYKMVGKGTRALARVKRGSDLRLLGPLGHGFTAPQGEGDWVGVAGGYGIAPFLQMAQQMKPTGRRLHLFYGARTKRDILYYQELTDLNVKLHITTEDGSMGDRGRVTEALARVYGSQKPAWVGCCGPMGLLHAVQIWCEGIQVPCELSVEETMGCGTGVCLGCVVKDREGRYRRACIEGPVFAGNLLEL